MCSGLRWGEHNQSTADSVFKACFSQGHFRETEAQQQPAAPRRPHPRPTRPPSAATPHLKLDHTKSRASRKLGSAWSRRPVTRRTSSDTSRSSTRSIRLPEAQCPPPAYQEFPRPGGCSRETSGSRGPDDAGSGGCPTCESPGRRLLGSGLRGLACNSVWACGMQCLHVR